MTSIDTNILIVDDDDFALEVLEATLSRLGYTTVTARNGEEALTILRKGEIHLLVTDWDMPVMNGVDLCRAVRREDLAGYVYIIMLTGREGPKQRLEGLCAGADDFINKPVDPEELLICLKTAGRILSLETRDLALFAMAKLAESRDPETGAHIERVQSYARLIAQNLSAEVRQRFGVDDAYVRLLFQTSPLHDLGKVAIPDAILLKAGRLSLEEFEVMKTHTVIGAQTLESALQRFPNAQFLQMAREIAETHHEHFDGCGYPRGLAGDQIPMCGRIVAVADVYDALTSRRVYKESMSHEEAVSIIRRDSGSHFDPEVVSAFFRAERQILQAREKLADESRNEGTLSIPKPPAPALRERGLPRILVAEDDELILEKLTELLSATGATVIARKNGQEAYQAILEHNPRVVVSDWMMPVMDGLELCRRVRDRDTMDPVHFIMLTAHTDTSRLLEAYDAGINEFVSKPFKYEELLARVRAGLRSARLHDDLAKKAAGSQQMSARLAAMNSRLERLSITDELTGMFNRRHAMTRLEEQWALVERNQRPLTIAMIDIDHFKQVNDMHGHDAGDAVLRALSSLLREHTRGTDAVCRVGGEEFLVIFPAQTIAEATICLERLRQGVQDHVIEIGHLRLKITVSVGIASRTPAMNQMGDLMKLADLMLYSAKRSGRNMIRTPLHQEAQEPCIIQTPSAVSPAPSQPAAPIHYNSVLERCGNDPRFAAAIIKKFQTHAREELDKIERAQAATSVEELLRAAHSLKSMCAFIAADYPSKLANEIENFARYSQLGDATALIPRLRDEVENIMMWIEQHHSRLESAAGGA